jgi:hypothetical protein
MSNKSFERPDRPDAPNESTEQGFYQVLTESRPGFILYLTGNRSYKCTIERVGRYTLRIQTMPEQGARQSGKPVLIYKSAIISCEPLAMEK